MIKHKGKFVSKKRKKKKFFKFVLFNIFVLCIYYGFKNINLNIKLAHSNQEFIAYMLNDSNHHLLYKKNNNIFRKLLLWISRGDVHSPVSLLESTFGYKDKEEYVDSEEDGTDEIDFDMNNYIKDPNPVDINNPRVYIYNTHQLESYSANNFEEYNITPNVMMASYLLKEKLNKLGTSTIVETSNITDFLSINGWSYASSYKASRFYMLDAINKYDNLDLLIDLHRDAVKHDSSTTEINGKKYAKVLFVVGLDYDNYGDNLALANNLNNKIKEKYPSLSRGVITKSGEGVNGIYNQDVANHVILLECGGNENTIEEVMNTIEVLSIIIHEYLG